MLRNVTVLHPTDFSALSELAFHVACSLPREHSGRCILPDVAELPLVVSGDTGIHLPPGGIREEIADQLRKIQAPDNKIPVVHRLAVGDRAAEILRVAEESKCDRHTAEPDWRTC